MPFNGLILITLINLYTKIIEVVSNRKVTALKSIGYRSRFSTPTTLLSL